MRTITDVLNLNGNVVITVRHPRHAPGHPMTDRIANATYEKCVAALSAGKTILIGNAPNGAGEMIARVNSRYHGKTIRTIRAVTP